MSSMLTAHGETLLDRFAQALDRMEKGPNEQRIHGLRITIKKLRTLLWLVENIAPEATRPKRSMQRIKALFHAAGVEREQQVSMAALDALRSMDGTARKAYRKRAKQRSKRARIHLLTAMGRLKKRDAERLVEYVRSGVKDSTRIKEVRAAGQLVQQELRSARTLFRTDGSDAPLHDVRKHIKHAWHILRLLADADAITGEQAAQLDRLGSLQQHLGDWHDLQVVQEDLIGKGVPKAMSSLPEVVGAELGRRRARLVKELGKVLEA